MSAGEPNYVKLNQMGKLPKDQRGKIGGLVQIDALEKQIDKLKKGMCNDCRAKLFPEAKKEASKPNA
jgi:hypothetical protein